MDKLKYVKLENPDGSYSNSIPLAVDAEYVDVNGNTLITELNNKATKSEVRAVASGSPAGTYATVANLITADPDHSKIYLVTADGHWYYYNGGWQDGGIYLATNNESDIEYLYNGVDSINDRLGTGDYVRMPLVATSTNYTLLPDGYGQTNNNYKIFKVEVVPNTIYRLDLENIDFNYYQFQNSSNINTSSDHSNPPVELVGKTMDKINNYLIAPEGSSFLVISVAKDSTENRAPVYYYIPKDQKEALIPDNDNNNSDDTSFTIPVCSDYNVWEPTFTTEEYTADANNSTVTCSLKYEDFLATYFDTYKTKCIGNSYTVQKRSLGRDSSKLYDIYEYDFIPKNYSRVVLLSAGMNSNELPGEFGIAYLIKNLFESNDPGMVWLKENVRFKIIPCMCPWSFDQNYLQYMNYNNVSLNQNFDYNGSWETVEGAGSGNKGAYPDSEAETQIILKWLDANTNYADLWIDCHTNAMGAKSMPALFYTFASDLKTASKVIEAQKEIRNFYIDKGYITLETPNVGVGCPVAPLNRYPKHQYSLLVNNIPSIMIEQNSGNFRYGAEDENYQNSDADIKNYVVMLRSYILAVLKSNFSHKYFEQDFFRVLYQEYKKYLKKVVEDKYEYGGFDSSGNPTSNLTTRVRSIFLEVPQNSVGEALKIHTNNNTIKLVEAFFYDENLNVIGSAAKSSINSDGYTNITKTLTADMKYFRYSIKKADESDITDFTIFENSIGTSLNLKSLDSKYNFYSYELYTNGFLPSQDCTRIATDYIPTSYQQGVYINFNDDDIILVDVVLCDENKNPLGNLSALQKERLIFDNILWLYEDSSFFHNAKYVRFTAKRQNNKPFIIEKLNFSVKTESE